VCNPLFLSIAKYEEEDYANVCYFVYKAEAGANYFPRTEKAQGN